jgi:Ca2+-binding EF-hand superfamily protein
MLSELQKRKFTRIFQIRDADENGTLEREDIKAINLRIKALLNLSEDEYFTLRQRSMISWEHLRQTADKDKDGKISLSEWLGFCDDMVNNKDNYELFLIPTVEFFMELFDRDHDGTFSFSELKVFLQAHNIPDEKSLHKWIWGKLDLNGDGSLSKEEVLTLLQQFCFSKDPSEPGNFVFGPC